MINFNARSVEIASSLTIEVINMSYGANISYTSERVNNYNSYLSETDEELKVKREIFAKSPNSYFLDLHYLDKNPPAIVRIRGKQVGTTDVASLLDIVFYERMKYAREYGQKPREKSTFTFG